MTGTVVWGELAGRYPAAWIDHLMEAEQEAEDVDHTPASLAAIGATPDERATHVDLEAAARQLLDELAGAGWLDEPTVVKHCRLCGFELPPGHTDDNCPNPEEESHSLSDLGTDEERSYHRDGIDRRYVGWLLALHGMNTRGSWQESFNWLVSTSYGRMVPVAIYKYGTVRPGVLARRRHATLRRQLVARIARARDEAAKVVRDPRPDVIAHSFGTLLLGHALHENPEVHVGRIITLGCILRPDFDWATLVRRGQVEAVLNHFGTEDSWAARAHATIPDAGPAGRRGFDLYPEVWDRADPPVFNVPAPGFSHSQFFEDEGDQPTTLTQQFQRVWELFLTTKDPSDIRERLEGKGNALEVPTEQWRPSRWPLRAITGGWGRSRYTY